MAALHRLGDHLYEVIYSFGGECNPLKISGPVVGQSRFSYQDRFARVFGCHQS